MIFNLPFVFSFRKIYIIKMIISGNNKKEANSAIITGISGTIPAAILPPTSCVVGSVTITT